MDSISRTNRDSQWRRERFQDINLGLMALRRDLCSSWVMLFNNNECLNDGLPVVVLEARAASIGYFYSSEV